MSIEILVVDDEPLARRKLASLIDEVPWAVQVGEAADGAAAVETALHLRPDVMFLDIVMPELSGIEVVRQTRRFETAPAVVFTTAYDQHAVTAFELQAVDYLLKPFGTERFQAALERARERARQPDKAAQLERACAALTAADTDLQPDRLFVREGNAIVPLSLSDIERVEAQDDYVMIYTHRRAHLVSLRMQYLEAVLPQPPFLRVHRSHIVNLDRVERMVGLDDARFEVRMSSGAVVPASRRKSKEFRRLAR